MGWIVCAHCGADLEGAATRCPRCGADPRTGEGAWAQPSGPRTAPLWRRALLFLAASLAVGGVFVFLLRAACGDQADSPDIYHTICAIVGLVALFSGIAGATGARIGTHLRPWDRGQASGPLVTIAMIGFGVTVLGVGFAASPPTRLQPSGFAGWATDAGPVRSVTASWIQPTVRSKAIGSSSVAFWVGLQGRLSHTVEQIGVDGECTDSGPADYQPWYESYPQAAVPIDEARLLISPGDRITATVAALGRGRYRLALVDHTTLERFVTTQTVTGVGDTDAAILVEAPSDSGSSLASFDPVRFTSCDVDGRPLGDFALSGSDIVVDGAAKTTTSDPNDTGDGFSVSFNR